jgi:hypothetical protein
MRLMTRNGPVHVWWPAGYDASTAGTVVRLHNYYLEVDAAWAAHELPRQFAGSALNALFLAPEAPVGDDDLVRWNELPRLLQAVSERSNPTPA